MNKQQIESMTNSLNANVLNGDMVQTQNNIYNIGWGKTIEKIGNIDICLELVEFDNGLTFFLKDAIESFKYQLNTLKKTIISSKKNINISVNVDNSITKDLLNRINNYNYLLNKNQIQDANNFFQEEKNKLIQIEYYLIDISTKFIYKDKELPLDKDLSNNIINLYTFYKLNKTDLGICTKIESKLFSHEIKKEIEKIKNNQNINIKKSRAYEIATVLNKKILKKTESLFEEFSEHGYYLDSYIIYCLSKTLKKLIDIAPFLEPIYSKQNVFLKNNFDLFFISHNEIIKYPSKTIFNYLYSKFNKNKQIF
jgi:hypothetical protein